MPVLAAENLRTPVTPQPREAAAPRTPSLIEQGVLIDKKGLLPDTAFSAGKPSNADLPPAAVLMLGAQRPSERLAHVRLSVDAALAPYNRSKTDVRGPIADIVVSSAIAGVTQPDETINQAARGFDAQAAHPVLRTRVAEIGMLKNIKDRVRKEDVQAYFEPELKAKTATDIRRETAVRTAATRVWDYLSSQNGSGPDSADRQEILRQTQALTESTFEQVKDFIELDRYVKKAPDEQPATSNNRKTKDAAPQPYRYDAALNTPLRRADARAGREYQRVVKDKDGKYTRLIEYYAQPTHDFTVVDNNGGYIDKLPHTT